MSSPEFDVTGWLKDLSPIVLALDIDLAYLCILGLAGYPDNDEEYFGPDGPPYIPGRDFFLGERYSPRLVAWQDSYGRVFTEEVSEAEYLNILSGNGYESSRPKIDPPYTVTEMFAELEKLWADRIPGWTITVGDDEGHIIRSEN